MEKKIRKWLNNKEKLEKDYNFYVKRKILQAIPISENLVSSYIEKSEHNLEYSYFLLSQDKFLDWAVVGWYYSAYHFALALLTKKGFSSKDHNSTICFLIKNFLELSKEEISLIDDLFLSKEDIEIYTNLKEEKKQANYSSQLFFTKEYVENLRQETISLINKMRGILGKT